MQPVLLEEVVVGVQHFQFACSVADQQPVLLGVVHEGVDVFLGAMLPDGHEVRQLPHPDDVVVGGAGEPSFADGLYLEVDESLEEIGHRRNLEQIHVYITARFAMAASRITINGALINWLLTLIPIPYSMSRDRAPQASGMFSKMNGASDSAYRDSAAKSGKGRILYAEPSLPRESPAFQATAATAAERLNSQQKFETMLDHLKSTTSQLTDPFGNPPPSHTQVAPSCFTTPQANQSYQPTPQPQPQQPTTMFAQPQMEPSNYYAPTRYGQQPAFQPPAFQQYGEYLQWQQSLMQNQQLFLQYIQQLQQTQRMQQMQLQQFEKMRQEQQLLQPFTRNDSLFQCGSTLGSGSSYPNQFDQSYKQAPSSLQPFLASSISGYGIYKKPLRHSPDSFEINRSPKRQKILIIHSIQREELSELEEELDRNDTDSRSELSWDDRNTVRDERLDSPAIRKGLAICKIFSSTRIYHEYVQFEPSTFLRDRDIVTEVKHKLESFTKTRLTVRVVDIVLTAQLKAECVACEVFPGLPEGYECYYTFRDGNMVENLRIANECGAVEWAGRVSIANVDFTKGPKITENGVQLWDSNGIAEPCTVTLKLLTIHPSWRDEKGHPNFARLQQILRKQCKKNACQFLSLNSLEMEWQFQFKSVPVA